MQLIVVRHATALNVGEQGIPTDRARFLSPVGRQEAASVGRALTALEYAPVAVFSSPLRRAVETADLLACELSNRLKVEISNVLEPGASAGGLIPCLQKAPNGDIVIVGHAPDVAGITAGFVFGREGADVRFGKAAAACIKMRDPRLGGRLQWFMKVDHMRRIAEST